jgi:serine/threonine protein kinase
MQDQDPEADPFKTVPKLDGLEEAFGRMGPYEIGPVIGEGGMGRVYAGKDIRSGQHVAVKVMLPGFEQDYNDRARFFREAGVLASLKSRYIVPVLDIGETKSGPFIVMPWLRGETLARRLRRACPVPIQEFLSVSFCLTSRLAAAHREGVIHRDIKPSNVFLDVTDRRAKILDYGLADYDEAVRARLHKLSRPSARAGTPGFWSPEQAAGLRADKRSDLFSLGCVMHLMAFGKMGSPTQRVSPVDEFLTPLMRGGRENASLPDMLVGLIRRLLAREPEHRPSSAQEVLKRLHDYVTATQEFVLGPEGTGQ